MGSGPRRILLIGVNDEIRALIQDLVGSSIQVEARLYEAQPTATSAPSQPAPLFALFGPPPEQVPVLELATALKTEFPGLPTYLAGPAKDGFNKELLIQSGFTDVFMLPFDRQLLREALGRLLDGTGLPPRAFSTVQLNDLEAGATFEFDLYVYLPANTKYLKLLPSGDALDAERLQRLKTRHVRSVFTPASQADLFRSYMARRLAHLPQDQRLSETQRREHMRNEVRGFIADLFSPHNASLATGRIATDDCRGIIEAYVMNSDYRTQLQRLRELLGNLGSPYSHASNVSMLAALLSMALGVGKPEDFAIAGLLHDLGETEVSSVILETPRSKWSKGDTELYRKHPQHTIDTLQANRMILPEIVHKMILQHHERYDGSGYPKGVSGIALSKESQILGLADELEERSSLTPGAGREEPLAVLDSLKKQSERVPGSKPFDPILLGEVRLLFEEALKPGQAAAA